MTVVTGQGGWSREAHHPAFGCSVLSKPLHVGKGLCVRLGMLWPWLTDLLCRFVAAVGTVDAP